MVMDREGHGGRCSKPQPRRACTGVTGTFRVVTVNMTTSPVGPIEPAITGPHVFSHDGPIPPGPDGSLGGVPMSALRDIGLLLGRYGRQVLRNPVWLIALLTTPDSVFGLVYPALVASVANPRAPVGDGARPVFAGLLFFGGLWIVPACRSAPSRHRSTAYIPNLWTARW